MSAVVQSGNATYVAITIPANGGTGSSLQTLLTAAGYTGPALAVAIDSILAGSTGATRPAFLAATPRTPGAAIAAGDFTTHGRYVPAGLFFYDPVDASAGTVYVQSVTASTIVALAVVFF